MTPTENTTHLDTLVHARWLIPIVPQNTCLEQHSVAFNKGRIVDILPTAEATQRYTADNNYDLSSHAIMPGLINAHGHTAMSLFRGLADDLPLMTWLNEHIWPAEAKWVSEDFVRDGTRLAMAEMIRGGTTCFSDMYFFPDITAEEASRAGMKAQLCCPVLDFPSIWAAGPDEYLSKALALRERYADNPLVDIGLGPHAPYTVSDAPLMRIRDITLDTGMPVQIHLHETQHEVDDAIKLSGQRPIRRLYELGLLSDSIPLQCVHMTALTDEDISLIAECGAHVVHCPESNMKLASGFCPTAKLLDNGVNVALGTDGAASNNDLDLLGEMRSAALIAKAVSGNAAAVNAHTALEMATINGARALGMEKTSGSLEKGKAADLIAINLDALNSQPSYDPISDIVYSVSANQVSHSWINGKLQLCDGDLCHFDHRKLIENAQLWATKIQTKS